MRTKKNPFLVLRQKEPELAQRVEALEGNIGKSGVFDILAKAQALVSHIPEARLSVVDKSFNLVAVSKKQQETFFPNGMPQGTPCYAAYNNFQAKCDWCAADGCMSRSEVRTTTGVVSPESLVGPPDPELVVSDIIAIPCGKITGTGTSHCIELVFIVTQRERERAELRFRIHQFMRVMFDRLRESTSNHTLQRLLLFGCLKAGGERASTWNLYVVGKDWQNDLLIQESLSLDRSPETDALWERFLKEGNTLSLPTIAASVPVKQNVHKRTEDWPGMNPERWKSVAKGQIERFGRCRKAVAFVPGFPEHDVPHFLLMMDKSGNQDFVTFEEMICLSNYATFCRQVVANRRVYQERERISLDFERLVDLSQGPLRDAYAGSMIISAAHTGASVWRTSLKDTISSIIALIPPETIKARPGAASLIENCNSSVEAMSAFFKRMDRWRALSKVKRRPVQLHECVENVLAGYKERFRKIGAKLEVFCSDRMITVAGDATYVDEIVMNLLQNAFDALQDRSTPRISVSITANAEMGEIRVEDNGSGFPMAEKDALWIPGYTTKELGTGVGLAFVKYATEAMKGRVSCYSNPNSSTGFIVQIPLWKEK